MAQLLGAGVVLEDVVLQEVYGNNQLLLAALAPAAATLKSLSIDCHHTRPDVQDTRNMEVRSSFVYKLHRGLSCLPH